MNSVKLNKKHLFSILITLVLLFSLNLNTFASSYTYSFYDGDYNAYYRKTDGTDVDVTSSTSCDILDGYFAPNGRSYTRYTFSKGSGYERIIVSNINLNLYTNTQYNYDFQFGVSGYNCPVNCKVILYISNQSEFMQIPLFDNDVLIDQDWSNAFGTFTTPDFSGNVKYSLFVSVTEGLNSSGANGIKILLSDIYCSPQGPLYGEPITPADTSGLTSIMGDYNNSIDQLPSLKNFDTDSLFDFNFDSYTSSLSFVKDMFDSFMTVFGFQSILVFALAIGLATYIIGRKVG